jgi:hypothetical protein
MAGPWEKYAQPAQQPSPAPWSRYAPQGPQGPSVSSVAAQTGAGSQVGIANALGFPVDAIAGAINGLGAMRPQVDSQMVMREDGIPDLQVSGITQREPIIQNPIGGSASIDSLMQPLRANIPEPQNRAERIGRRVGEEVGASAAMAPVAMGSAAVRAAPGLFAGTEAAAALGSGAGAAIANEVAPDSMTAEIVGALTGGLTGGGLAARTLGTGATPATMRGGIEDQRMRAADAYAHVRADQRVLPQQSTDTLVDRLTGRMGKERLNPRLHPSSAAILDAVTDDAARPLRIEDVEDLRRMTEQNMPAQAVKRDRTLGGFMKDEITDYLDSLNDPVADSLREGRDAYRRASAAQSIDDASTRAARRAASTGSGGNEINAMRQNLRSILDNPRKARSFKPEELEMMEQVVRGTADQNVLRRLSRFAPSSGGLSAMLGIGGTMASPAIALPVMAVTELAKGAGERSTRATIDALMQSIAPNRVLKPGDQGMTPVIRALLAGRTASGGE